jgi:transcriptional regulator GlxA family with amidase domain
VIGALPAALKQVQVAAQSLRGTSMALIDIAEQVGYESEAAFSRAFKRAFGEPPATWRRKHRA